MTNNEALVFSQTLTNMLSGYFDDKSKIELSQTLYFGAKKNVRRLESLEKEFKAIDEDIQASFKKKEKISEEDLKDEVKSKIINEKYSIFRKDITAEADFLVEDSKIELHKVSENAIFESVIPMELERFLIKYLAV